MANTLVPYQVELLEDQDGVIKIVNHDLDYKETN